MPIIKSAKKALRQSKRNRKANERRKSQTREAVSSFRKDPTSSLLKKAFSALDRAVDNRVIHKNKASRLKSNLSKLLSLKSS
ncbi:MAG: 30S ribosomal protein S20 [Candidatus Blackburnbacteria bacterium]|nr:30S ribosomal protein S20 [Candidatus Blackburnbacteria bacterium]